MQYYNHMGTIDKQLEQMRNNPRNWRIQTLIALATKHGIEVRNHGGSHHVFSFPGIELGAIHSFAPPDKARVCKEIS
jgi:hypothetical protein